MGFFNNLAKLATDIIVMPLAIVSDVIHAPDLMLDEKESKTKQKLGDVLEDLETLVDNKTN